MDFIGFKRLDVPLYTPTTEADVGHEENMTHSDLVGLLGKEMAEWPKQAALALFVGESATIRACELILIDTKYEFGLDRDGDRRSEHSGLIPSR